MSSRACPEKVLRQQKRELIIIGCGCGKSKSAQVPGAGSVSARRATVYQVMADSVVVSEYDTLPEARLAATEAGGRVKVTTKLV